MRTAKERKRSISLFLMVTVFLCAFPAEGILYPETISIHDLNDTNGGSGNQTFGAVDYAYNIGKYEVKVSEWDEFYNALDSADRTTLGLNPDYDLWEDPEGRMPAVKISYHQAAAFCNYLTSEDWEVGYYRFNGGGSVTSTTYSDHKALRTSLAPGETVYVVPSEDEWYKAAYYSGDSQYSLYASGTNETPAEDLEDGWNYNNTYYEGETWKCIGSGAEEQNHTYDIMGNVWEWMEDDTGVIRGGGYNSSAFMLASSYRYTGYGATSQVEHMGFRVVSLIPEPTTGSLLLGSLLMGLTFGKKRF